MTGPPPTEAESDLYGMLNGVMAATGLCIGLDADGHAFLEYVETDERFYRGAPLSQERIAQVVRQVDIAAETLRREVASREASEAAARSAAQPRRDRSPAPVLGTSVTAPRTRERRDSSSRQAGADSSGDDSGPSDEPDEPAPGDAGPAVVPARAVVV